MTEVTRGRTGLTFQIGEVAERTGMSPRTIRHYDDLGIVKPSGRTDGGFRLYTSADIDRFMLIKPLKPLGIGLDVIRTLLRALDTLDEQQDSEARRTVETVLALIDRRRSELGTMLDASGETITVLQRALPEELAAAERRGDGSVPAAS
jgi:MerR family transcriptional regulator, copper efflux regulator